MHFLLNKIRYSAVLFESVLLLIKLLEMFSCAAADVDDITMKTELRDYHEPSSDDDHPALSTLSATGDGVSDVRTPVHDDVTHDTAADVSTQFHGSAESIQRAVIKKYRSSTELRWLDVESDDRPSTHQHSAAISLLLWKLTQLERTITVSH